MKYLKAFENIDNYKEGDYIILTTKITWIVEPFYVAKIINIGEDGEFSINALKIHNNQEFRFYTFLDSIERKATKDEIDEYKLRKALEKYNL